MVKQIICVRSPHQFGPRRDTKCAPLSSCKLLNRGFPVILRIPVILFAVAWAAVAFDQLNSAPTGLIPKAHRQLSKIASASPAAQPTSPSYSSTTWAQQTLGINISNALAKHIHRSLANASAVLTPGMTAPIQCLHSPLNQKQPPSVLAPLPHFLAPAT